MPIDGLSGVRRAPRLGKIRLGIKVPNKSGNGEHPEATDYFVCPPELLKALGLKEDGKPRELPIMFPTEDESQFAQQWYRAYSMTRGLICKGDGKSCARMVDTETGAMANRNSKHVEWREGMDCQGRDCPDYQAERCKETMNLQFIMPTLPGLGIWQIDTGSVNSIININSAVDFIRGVYKRISFIPLILALEPQQVVNPDDGKKKTVHTLTLKTKGTMMELMASAARPAMDLLLPTPVTTEPPEDVEIPDEEKPEPPRKVVDCQPSQGAPETISQEIPPGSAGDNEIEWGTGHNGEPIKETGQAGTSEKYPTSPATIITQTDLLKACSRDFGMKQPQVMKELNITSMSKLDMKPSEAYIQIAAVRITK